MSIPLAWRALFERLRSEPRLTLPVYRAPVIRGEYPLPYITAKLFTPGVDDRSVCGGTAFEHPVFEVVVWARESVAEDMRTAEEALGVLSELLSGWSGEFEGVSICGAKVSDLDDAPMPTDPQPWVRGMGAYWRLDMAP